MNTRIALLWPPENLPWDQWIKWFDGHFDVLRLLRDQMNDLTNSTMKANTAAHIQFDKEKAEAFRKAYTRTKGEGITEKVTKFEFEGHVFDMGYAKYMIEYLIQQGLLT